MQNSYTDFLLSDIKNLDPKPKKLALIEEHIGKRIIDIITFKPKRLLSAKICKDITTVSKNEEVLLEIKVLKHHENFFNKRIPYKISALHKEHKIVLIFFSKFTGYLKKIFPKDQDLLVKGKVELYKKKYQISHPEIIEMNSMISDSTFLKVVYKQKKSLKSDFIHSTILKICSYLPELNEWNIDIFKYFKETPSFKNSILNIHNPMSDNTLSDNSPYIIRLAYDEIFSYQLSLEILRNNLDKLTSNTYNFDSKDAINHIRKILPFNLTGEQLVCSKEIIQDLSTAKRTLRLLQGDVGSGKTVVAAISAYYVLKSGYQVVILAPTELLAKQHYNFFNKTFYNQKLEISLLLSSSVDKKDIKKKIYSGEINLIIGTHALFQKDVKFRKLSYVIIDEQHRFGVEQRFNLIKKGKKVDMLLLTATPIPRTMMLTVLGDISVSTIKKKPYNSKTKTILKSEKNISQVISFLNQRISMGEKVFWVCPRIDNENIESDASVENRYFYLKKIFKSSAMLHGKMKSEEKTQVLDNFRDGNINLIVSTVVIEVGIDVPDANIIVIDNANTFGLAQIHQLRGRVGRGRKEGVCILIYNENLTELATERLSILKMSQNGFDIAEKDLKLRGSGEIIGTQQYGAEDFKFFNFENHYKLAEIAKEEAKKIVANDPKLKSERGRRLLELLRIFKKIAAANLLTAG